MEFTVKEMELLCVFHSGTRSATIDLLREAAGETSGRQTIVHSALEKLSGMEAGDVASLAFEPEK